jgi:hypothetical protein
MPNNMFNVLRLTGKESIIAQILKDIKTEDNFIDFEKIIPIPNIDWYNSKDNWYKWNIQNWGTKWNSYDSKQLNNVIYFTTAYSSPFPIIEQLSKLYKTVKFTLIYFEESNDIQDIVVYKNGKII